MMESARVTSYLISNGFGNILESHRSVFGGLVLYGVVVGERDWIRKVRVPARSEFDPGLRSSFFLIEHSQ